MNFKNSIFFAINLMICSLATAGGGEGDKSSPQKPQTVEEFQQAKADKRAAAEAEEQKKRACATQDLAIIVGLKSTITNALVGFDNSLPVWARQTPEAPSSKPLALANIPNPNSLLITVDPRSSAINQILGVMNNEVASLPDDFTRYIYLKTLFVRNPEWRLRVGPGQALLSIGNEGELEKRMRDFRGGLFELAGYLRDIEKAWNFQPNAYGWPSRVMSFDISQWAGTLNIFPNKTTNINVALAVERVWERALNKVFDGKPLDLSGLEDFCSAVLYDYKLTYKISVEEFLKLPAMTELVKASYYLEVRKKTQVLIEFWRAFKQRQDILSKAGLAEGSSADILAVEQEYANMAAGRVWSTLDGKISEFFKKSPFRREVRDQILRDLQVDNRRAKWIASKLYIYLLQQKKIEEVGVDVSARGIVSNYLQKQFGVVGEIAPEKTAEFDNIFGGNFFAELEKAKSRNYSDNPLSEQAFEFSIRNPVSNGFVYSGSLPEGSLAVDGVMETEGSFKVRLPGNEVEIPDFVSASARAFSVKIKKHNPKVTVGGQIEARISDYVRFVSILNLAKHLKNEQSLNSSDFLQSLLAGNLEGFRHMEVDGFISRQFSSWEEFENFLKKMAEQKLKTLQTELAAISPSDLEKILALSEVQFREFRSLVFNNKNFPKIPNVASAKRYLMEFLESDAAIDETSLKNLAKSLAMDSSESSQELRQNLSIWIREARPEEIQNRLHFIAYRDFMLGSL